MPGEMPRLGLGTYQQTDRETCIEGVETAALAPLSTSTEPGWETTETHDVTPAHVCLA